MAGDASERFDPGDFAVHAQPGDRRVYGHGPHPPREAVRAMQPFVDAGVLVPLCKREDGGFLFMVERGRGEMSAALARRQGRRGCVRRRRIRKTSLSMVFDCLVRAAKRGGPCPTNEELARRCRLSGKLAASYRVRRLVAEERISVEDHSPFARRVVTILAGPHAGKQTCEAAL